MLLLPRPAMIVPGLACAAAYAVLAALILLQARRSRSGRLLALAGGATACWALADAFAGLQRAGVPWASVSTELDLLHVLAWYGFCLHLYRRAAGPGAPSRLFTLIGLGAAAGAGALMVLGRGGLSGTLDLLSPAILLRLGLAIAQLLLLENYWRGHAPDRRSPISLACIAFGALAAYDAVVCADAVLVRAASATLLAGRPLVALLVAPLVALAAARNRSWQVDIHVSRTAAFHTATLVVSGVFLLALAAAGELARTYAPVLGIGWGSLAELCLVCAGIITLAVVLTSSAARAALQRGVIDHFFTHRYDYRREWQRCIDTLTAGPAPLQERAIRALAAAVDSPAGQLFLRQPGQAGLAWAGAWNSEPDDALPLSEGQLEALESADRPLALEPGAAAAAWLPWLAVPLREPGTAGLAVPPGQRQVPALGVVVLGRPRVTFRMDAEVIDLLRVLAHEVAIHLAQQRATAVLLQTHDLREYGERFAFVAHDIKNVSSQLSLLLSNAETHVANPDFQQDMLATVRASVGRIGALIRRLEPARTPAAPVLLDPASLLSALSSSWSACGQITLALDIAPTAAGARVLMDPAAFRAAVGHLLDNAVNALRGAGTVRLALHATPVRVVLDIIDDGPGMTAEFVRDRLFQPFASGTPGGTGLGAFQARELLRVAGGELAVQSRPGAGTTMRLVLPRYDAPTSDATPAPTAAARLLSPAGA